MTIQEQITDYINSLPEPKHGEMETLHRMILNINPSIQLWFLDGKDSDGKMVTNPNIGYGLQIMKYADGKTREFYQVGISANKTGISVYILGISDKNYLINTYGAEIGKASVTGYCIKFKALKDINIETLKTAIQDRFEMQNENL